MSDNSKVAPLDVGPIRGQIVDAAGAVQFDSDALPAGPVLIGDETIVVSQTPDMPGAVPVAAKLSLVQLRHWLSGQFGCYLQSATDLAQTRMVVQTVGASPTAPLLVYFDQLFIAPFTGEGQFDLVERDASDVDVFDADGNYVSGGSSKVTIATKAGFTAGDTTGTWSRLVKVITVDKTYSVVFVPGDAGDGIYSMNLSGLSQGQT